MSALMNTEVDKLSVMYEGDKNRDAASKIRGFLKAKPRLYIHRDSAVEKPTLNKMIEFIGLKSRHPKSVSYPNTADSAAWLRTNVYSVNKKEGHKKKTFCDDGVGGLSERVCCKV